MSAAGCPPYYLTTAIDYVNAAPHLGHAYEKIAADVLARFHRLRGREVFFLTGTDEHGAKVAKTAASQDLSPQAFTDQVAAEFQKAWAALNLSYDRFIRTTEPAHYAAVAQVWRTMAAKGDLYKASYTGQYCTGCETFLTARDLTEDGLCPHHQRPPEPVAEENWFFRLSKYREPLKAHMQAHPDFILPAFRAQEVLRVLDELDDISVSRSVQSVPWGIPVPDDAGQVIYVWIDALSNYLTGVGYGQDEAHFRKHWPAQLHLIGKDILRFHALYWPAMLMSLDLPLPKTIFAHGFITLNAAKLSKSLGNGVSAASLAERFELPNTDPIRYYLMTVAPFGQDGNFSEDDFKLRVNADLANNLGNLLNRAVAMTGKFLGGVVPGGRRLPELAQAPERFERVAAAYDQLAFHTAMEAVIEWVDLANRLINQHEPWALAKQGRTEDVAAVLGTVLEMLRQVAILIAPVTPVLAEGIWQQLGQTTPLSAARWSDLADSPLPAGQALQPGSPLLPRLEDEIVGAGAKKR